MVQYPTSPKSDHVQTHHECDVGWNRMPWPGVDGLQARMRMILPDRAQFKHFPTNSKAGGPWVMWPDTPYAHLMLPIDSYPPVPYREPQNA